MCGYAERSPMPHMRVDVSACAVRASGMFCAALRSPKEANKHNRLVTDRREGTCGIRDCHISSSKRANMREVATLHSFVISFMNSSIRYCLDVDLANVRRMR